MAPPRETRRERQQFLQRLDGQTAHDRERIRKEHAAYRAGEREDDADFGENPAPTRSATARPLLPVPIGKDARYMRAQRRLISQQQRAVAAKTLAGSGMAASRDLSDDDEDYDPDLFDEEADADADDERLPAYIGCI
ncbi:hypothetical protein PInf_008683 [Phytophthora infestans]|nr:hypothetical protein PInf_008683 [Phytophthora infestans]